MGCRTVLVFQLPKQARYQLRYTWMYGCYIQMGVMAQSGRASCCGARQSLRLAEQAHALPTAATTTRQVPRCAWLLACTAPTGASRSASFLRHRRRSPCFPTALHLVIQEALYTKHPKKATGKCQNLRQVCVGMIFGKGCHAGVWRVRDVALYGSQ